MAKRHLALAASGIFLILTVGHPNWITVNMMVESPKEKRKNTPKKDKRIKLKG
jgi:hypothetical protein